MTLASARASRAGMALQRGLAGRVAGACRRGDLCGGEIGAADVAVFARQARAAEQGLDAAALAAVAVERRVLAGHGPGQRVVAPFAGQAVGPAQHAAVHRDAGAGAGAEDHREHHRRRRRRRRRWLRTAPGSWHRWRGAPAGPAAAAGRPAAAGRSGTASWRSSSGRRASGCPACRGRCCTGRRLRGAPAPPARRWRAAWRHSRRPAWRCAGATARWPSADSSMASILVPPRSMPSARPADIRSAGSAAAARPARRPARAAPAARAPWRGRR